MSSVDSPCEHCLHRTQHPLYFCVAADNKEHKQQQQQQKKACWRVSVSRNPQKWVQKINALHRKLAKLLMPSEPDRFKLVLYIGPFTTTEKVLQVRSVIKSPGSSLAAIIHAVKKVDGDAEWFSESREEVNRLL